MPMLYAYILTRFNARVDRSERGDVIAWLVLAVLAVVVVVALIPQVHDLGQRVITFIGDQIGV